LTTNYYLLQTKLIEHIRDVILGIL